MNHIAHNAVIQLNFLKNHINTGLDLLYGEMRQARAAMLFQVVDQSMERLSNDIGIHCAELEKSIVAADEVAKREILAMAKYAPRPQSAPVDISFAMMIGCCSFVVGLLIGAWLGLSAL